jgi:hypothetical protein
VLGPHWYILPLCFWRLSPPYRNPGAKSRRIGSGVRMIAPGQIWLSVVTARPPPVPRAWKCRAELRTGAWRPRRGRPRRGRPRRGRPGGGRRRRYLGHGRGRYNGRARRGSRLGALQGRRNGGGLSYPSEGRARGTVRAPPGPAPLRKCRGRPRGSVIPARRRPVLRAPVVEASRPPRRGLPRRGPPAEVSREPGRRDTSAGRYTGPDKKD